MAAFDFKLDPVLRQRRLREETIQRELAQLLREQFILESQLRSVQQTIRDDKQRIGGRLVGLVDVTGIRQHAAHVAQTSIRARQFAGRLMGIHRRLEQTRLTLLEATRARKAVELLEQKQRRRWEREQRRIENAALDELAVMSHDRLDREALT